MSLAGKTAIVTGGSRGIGEATARVLGAAGVNVVLAARSGGEVGRIASEIEDAGGSAHAVTCDVSQWDNMREVVETARYRFGPVDILVNNAGVIDPIGPMAELDPGEWAKVIDINLKGVFNATRAVLPDMLQSGGGTIINIGSGAATHPLEGWSHYCTSKAGVLMLTQCTHHEYAQSGVVSVNLSPGTVATDMQRQIKASGINPVSQLDFDVHIPPDWPALAVKWLAGPDGASYGGQVVSLRDPDIRARIGLGA